MLQSLKDAIIHIETKTSVTSVLVLHVFGSKIVLMLQVFNRFKC
jgi:hypothetical protein